MAKGKILTEGELRRLPNGSQVFLVYNDPAIQGDDYEGVATVEQIDEAVVFDIGFKTLIYELSGDDTVLARSFSLSGHTIEVRHV